MTISDLMLRLENVSLAHVIPFLCIGVVLLYLARTPAHHAIKSLGRVMHNALRLMARSTLLAEKKVTMRNREVLFSSGLESAERIIEREFQRVDAVIKRDLSNFPVLQRSMADQLARVEEDYHKSAELPPPSPVWIRAIEAVAKIPSDSDSSVANILAEIHKTTEHQFKHTMEEFRKVSAERHGVLNRMMPAWRKLNQTLDNMGKKFNRLQERSRIIDTRMTEYEEIRARTDKAERSLTSSSLTQFFISAFVLLIAVGGAIINFNLIALPMSEMVGGGSYIGNFKTANVAALVIILVEVAMGFYLMESLRITHLFPIIGQMDDRMRHRMIWISFTILLVLALIESSLAFMRDHIAGEIQALRQSLSGSEVETTANSWIPMVGQMTMGFILPFALTFVAIPLESFVHSTRTVLGVIVSMALRGLAFLLRLVGNIIHYLGELTVNLYDCIIFPTLYVENKIRMRRREKAADGVEPATVDVGVAVEEETR